MPTFIHLQKKKKSLFCSQKNATPLPHKKKKNKLNNGKRKVIEEEFYCADVKADCSGHICIDALDTANLW